MFCFDLQRRNSDFCIVFRSPEEVREAAVDHAMVTWSLETQNWKGRCFIGYLIAVFFG